MPDIINTLRPLIVLPITAQQEQVQQLKSLGDKELIKLKRLAMAGALTPDEEKNLKKKNSEQIFYIHLLDQLKCGSSLATGLAEFNPTELGEDLAKELVSYWEEHYTQALQHEEQPLNLLELLAAHAATPLLLTGLIHSLIKREIRTGEILKSGLLHHYFAMHSAEIKDVQSVYSLLGLTQDLSKPRSVLRLINTVNNSACPPIRGFAMNLSGDFNVSTELNIIKIKSLKFTPTPVRDNLEQLLSSFGELFLKQLSLSSDYDEAIDWVTEKIEETPLEQLCALYQNILTSMAEEQRTVALERLSHALTIQQALKLLEEKKVSLWVMLSSKPKLFKQFNGLQLEDLISANPLSYSDMNYALDCLKHESLILYDESTHLQLIECLMQQPAVEVDERIIDNFRFHPQAFEWCTARSKELLSDFKREIEANSPLTADSYFNIKDRYLHKSCQWRLLEKLSPRPLAFPRDVFEAQSYIIKALFDKNQNLDLNCLNLFYPQENYQDYENSKQVTEQHQINALLVCLIKQDDEDLQRIIIIHMEHYYSISDWRLCTINQSTMFDQAKKHKNDALLKHYCSKPLSPSLCEQLQKQDGNGNTLFHKEINNSITVTLLSLYPKNELVKLINLKNNEFKTILHYALPNSQLLSAILSFIPQSELYKTLTKGYVHGESLLHSVVKYPESLRVCLSCLQENELFNALMIKDSFTSNVLESAEYYFESMLILFSYIPKNKHLDAMKAVPNMWSYKILKIPEKLNALFSLFDEPLKAAQLCNEHGETPLHCFADCPGPLKVILGLYPDPPQLLAAIKATTVKGDSVLHYAVNNESAEMLLALYPENQKLAAVKAVNYEQENLLDGAADNPELLKTLLQLYPKNEVLNAVIERKPHKKSVLEKAQNNSACMTAIRSLLPDIQLVNQRLVNQLQKKVDHNLWCEQFQDLKKQRIKYWYQSPKTTASLQIAEGMNQLQRELEEAINIYRLVGNKNRLKQLIFSALDNPERNIIFNANKDSSASSCLMDRKKEFEKLFKAPKVRAQQSFFVITQESEAQDSTANSHCKRTRPWS